MTVDLSLIPAANSDLPNSVRLGQWSVDELRGVIAIACNNTPATFIPAYRRWAAENGYRNRRIRRILKTFNSLGIEIPGYSSDHPWSPTELNKLAALTEDYPPGLIAAPYSSWALKSDYLPRTYNEVMLAAAAHFNLATWRPLGHWLHAADVADMLDVSISTVRHWIYGQVVKSHRDPDGSFFLHRASFEYVARERPAVLAVGATRAGLLALLSKPYLVDRVVAAQLQTPVPAKPRPRPVQLLDDLRWWPSPQVASRSLGIPATLVEQSATTGAPSPVGTFRYVVVPARCLGAA